MADLQSLDSKWEKCDKFMLGRGLIARPGMLQMSTDEEYRTTLSQEEWKRFMGFHDELVEGYYAYMCEDRNTLFKLKELWTWWAVMFPGQERLLKKIKKATTLHEYEQLVKMMCLM